MALLPIELVTLILARLPVKTLLRFRTVSKEWNSLTSNPYFIRLHRNHCPVGGHVGDQLLVSLACKSDSENMALQRIALDSHLTSTAKFEVPPALEFCCSCDCLLILQHLFRDYDDKGGYIKPELIMWNAMADTYTVLPSLDLPYSVILGLHYGLGYDESNRDFKLVCFAYLKDITDPLNPTLCNLRLIYSGKRNCWGPPVVKDTPYMKYWRGKNVLIDNHIIHWLFDGGYQKLGGFDICSEEWLHLPLPDLLEQHKFLDLGVLEDNLCVSSYDIMDDMKTHVWVMKEYGAKESWTKLFSLSGDEWCRAFPIAYSVQRDQLLHLYMKKTPQSRFYVWYNLKDKTRESIRDSGCYNIVTDCVASLVPRPTQEGVTAAAGSFRYART